MDAADQQLEVAPADLVGIDCDGAPARLTGFVQRHMFRPSR
jgi:hypothetical protein